MADRIQTFEAFWPYYVGEHRNPTCRGLHYAGTTLALSTLVYALSTGRLLALFAVPVAGYLFAWIGHFIVEKNRPATFTYPVWSLMGDFKMYAYFLTGRMGREVTRLYGSTAPSADAPLLSQQPEST